MTPAAPPLAAVLRETFRAAPVAPMPVSAHLLQVAEVTGVEALVRRRTGKGPSETERFQSLEFLARERWLASAFSAFQAHGIRAATFKGWAVARLYGGPGLRPVGDVDLVVHANDLDHARSVLAGLEGGQDVDLQSDLSRYLPDRRVEALLEASEEVAVPAGRIRVLGPADHLRLVCLHQLHHGSWRPLWLCDVAVLLESLPANFSWSMCLASRRHLGEGVLACVQLACEWLGASPEVPPPAFTVPAWFRGAVARAWERGHRPTPERIEGISWARLPAALRDRWPDPLSSTLHLDAPFHGVPRLPIQLAELVRRGSWHALRRFRARPEAHAHSNRIG
ncbi:MAG TPA: nucleotidyltransferase family protein [Myxococcaceae bacterium]|nr:nucleotidyltransferase family protein [Myxococcaceae bacterium]